MTYFVQTTQFTRRAPVCVEPQADLSTDIISMRPLGYSDESAFLQALERSRTDLRRWIPLESKHESPTDFFHCLVNKGIAGSKAGTSCRRAVFLSDNTFVGMFNIIKIDRGLEWTAELNWWIDSSLAGKGLGSHALQSLVDHALTDLARGLGLHKLRAMICLDNPGSVHLAEKIGFSNTGYKDLLEINHALVMHHEFSISI